MNKVVLQTSLLHATKALIASVMIVDKTKVVATGEIATEARVVTGVMETGEREADQADTTPGMEAGAAREGTVGDGTTHPPRKEAGWIVGAFLIMIDPEG